MKRPSLQFYPGDWQSNPKLRRCSHAEKGIWLDVMCILHDQDEYGIVRWPLRDLALAVHARVAQLQQLVKKGVLKGVDEGECEPFVFTPRHGRKDGEPVILIKAQPGPIWYSSRMVRDEHVRQVRADNEIAPKIAPMLPMGEGFGETLGANGRSHPSRAGVSSSSSSSSSSSEKKVSSSIGFIEKLKTNPAYAHIDIDVEVHKMTAWLQLPKNKHRKLTPSFALNWLNKIERPIAVENGEPKPKEERKKREAEIAAKMGYNI